MVSRTTFPSAKDRARVTGQSVVYIEDSVANLQRARDFAVSSNAEVRLIYVGPERDTGFESYEGIEMLAAELHEKPLTGTLIVSDMDGVLLHEDYRSEHQKKNMHCALQALGAHI
jgi:UDP-N-acetylmuramoylalanine-D-glutamate ligase